MSAEVPVHDFIDFISEIVGSIWVVYDATNNLQSHLVN